MAEGISTEYLKILEIFIEELYLYAASFLLFFFFLTLIAKSASPLIVCIISIKFYELTLNERAHFSRIMTSRSTDF